MKKSAILQILFFFSLEEMECEEGNPEGLKLLRESLKKVQVSSTYSCYIKYPMCISKAT